MDSAAASRDVPATLHEIACVIHRPARELTTVMTIMPGDLLATGTPAGIGAPTGKFLRVGDVVRAEIEGPGVIENRVVAPPLG